MIHMKNNKGQALIEFILILPILLILIFTTIDIFNLINNKNNLETKVSDQIKLFNSNKITLEQLQNSFDDKYDVKIKKENNFIELYVSKNNKWISPITGLILKEEKLSVKRVIPNE